MEERIVSAIRVLLAEDHTIVRKGLRALLDEEAGIEVIGEAQDGREAVQMVEQLRPDVVLMDISMPGLNGLEATRQIKAQFPDARVLVLTRYANEEYVYQQSDVWEDPKLRRFVPWRQLVPHTRRRVLRPRTDYSYPLLAQGLADVIAEGGGGAIGSHGQLHGLASHWEIWMAASALGPAGALELASPQGARFLGAQEDLGSIRVGKLADLVVLHSDPLTDIRATADIEWVMKGGVLYDADTLDEIWPRERPYGAYPWVEPRIFSSDDRPVEYWDRGGERQGNAPGALRPE